MAFKRIVEIIIIITTTDFKLVKHDIVEIIIIL